MTAKRKRRKLKPSFVLFAVLFVFLIILMASHLIYLKCTENSPEQTPTQDDAPQNEQDDKPGDTTEPVTTAYNEFIDVTTVTGSEGTRVYPKVKDCDLLNKAISEAVEALPCNLTLEKAYFNQSYFSAALRAPDGSVYALNFAVEGQRSFDLAEAAPALFLQYGQNQFFVDGQSLTLYLPEGDASFNISEFDGWRHLPYSPPEYTPAGTDEKVIALTFDDGPRRSDLTEKILDKLIQRRAKATFFVLGQECPTKGETLKRVLRVGCEIGNHSYHHEQLNKLTRQEALESITKTQEIVYQKTGVYPRIMRPPYGDERVDIMQELGLFNVEWCVDPEDWKLLDADAVVQHVKQKAQSGYIVLMHDTYDSSEAAAEQLIDYFCDNGWRLVTISELFDLENREFTTEILRMK